MPTVTLKPASGGFGSVHADTASWAASYGATTGTVDTGNYVYAEAYNSGSTYKIWRYFAPIDTSSLPDNAIIDSATFTITIYDVVDTDNDGDDFLSVIQTTQGNAASLAAGDFDNVGSVEGSNRIDVNDLATGWAINTFTLNATGKGWINKSGITNFGIRVGHDLLNHAVTANTQVSPRIYEDANSPYLTITYHQPKTGTGAFFQFL